MREVVTDVMAEPVAQIASVLDALHCGAILARRDGVIAHANPRVCEWLGRARAELIGRPVAGVVDPAYHAALAQRFAEFERPSEVEFELLAADGRRLPVLSVARQYGSTPPYSDYRVTTLFDARHVKAAERRATAQYEAIATLSDTVLEQALALKTYARELEQKVRERTEELRQANMDCIYALALASEARDADTGAHVLRIQELTRRLCEAIGLPPDECDRIGYAAILHDVGKIVTPDAIIKKPGPLTGGERLEMQRHTLEGERILPNTPFFAVARRIARWHHENWDGSGYPDGKRGEEIPLEARVVHLVDVCDALLFERVYKSAWTRAETLASITQGAGVQFDPRLVAALNELWRSGGLDDILRQASPTPT